MRRILILILLFAGLGERHEPLRGEPIANKFLVKAFYRNKIEVYEINAPSQKEAEKQIIWLHSGSKVVK